MKPGETYFKILAGGQGDTRHTSKEIYNNINIFQCIIQTVWVFIINTKILSLDIS